MTLYPQLPVQRARAVAWDAMVVLGLVVFVWLGLRVYHDIDQLSALGTGVSQAGAGVGSGFSAAAGATGSVPIVGGPLADGSGPPARRRAAISRQSAGRGSRAPTTWPAWSGSSPGRFPPCCSWCGRFPRGSSRCGG